METMMKYVFLYNSRMSSPYLLPESFLYIEGKLTKKNEATGELNVKLFERNCMTFLFEEMHSQLVMSRYVTLAFQIDRKNGVTKQVDNFN